MSTQTTQLYKLKLLLGISDNSKDFILEFTLIRVEESIKNYCNIDGIPTELNNTVLTIAMDAYRSENLGSEEYGSTVKSVQIGDTSTSFENNKVMNKTKELLNGFKKELAPFRKLRW